MTEREVPDHAAQLQDAAAGLRPWLILRVRPTGAWRWGMKAICLRAHGGPEAFAYE